MGATTPLDEFLAGTASDHADDWRHIGLWLGTLGGLAAVGLLVFLAVCVRDHRHAVRRLLALTSVCGAVLGAGATIELVGIAEQFDAGWRDVFELDASSGPMLRLLGGVLLLFGLEQSDDDAHDGDPVGQHEWRWRPGVGSMFGVAGGLATVLSFAFDGHSVSEGPRLVHFVVDVVHVLAAATWLGGVLGLVTLLASGRGEGWRSPTLVTVVGFSRLATWALIVVATAGVAIASIIVDDLDQLTRTAWGHRLLAKTAAVGVAALIAAYNHFALVPRLRTGAAAPTMRRLRTAVIVEVVVLLVVVLLTVALVSASPSDRTAATSGDIPTGTSLAGSIPRSGRIMDDGAMQFALAHQPARGLAR